MSSSQSLDAPPRYDLFKQRKFKEANIALEEQKKKLLADGHKVAAARAEAWGLLALTICGVEGLSFQEAAARLQSAEQLFSILQPLDKRGNRLCQTLHMEMDAYHLLKEKRFWEARKVANQIKANYVESGDVHGVHRAVLTSALAEGLDFDMKGDLCFAGGEFKTSVEAFDAASSAYLSGNIHSAGKIAEGDDYTADLRHRIAKAVAVCVNKREKARDLAAVLDRAVHAVEEAEASAKKLDFGFASEKMQVASHLYGQLGSAYEVISRTTRERGEGFSVQKLSAEEEEIERLMKNNEYPAASALAMQTCRHYSDLVVLTKRTNPTVAKEARLGHVRTTAAVIEIAGTQSWWIWYNNCTESLPDLPHAFPGWLMNEGAAGMTRDALRMADPSRTLSDLKNGAVLFEHHKRVARRGYEHGMLFGEASRLLAVAGKSSTGLRLQLFRAIERGFSDWAQKHWESAANTFASAAENVANSYFGADAFDRSKALKMAQISFHLLSVTARAFHHIDIDETNEELAAELRESLDQAEELKETLGETHAGLDLFLSNAERALELLLPDEEEDEEGEDGDEGEEEENNNDQQQS